VQPGILHKYWALRSYLCARPARPFPGKTITQSPNISRRGRCLFPGKTRFAPSTLAWAMIRMLLKGHYGVGSLPGRDDMPLASGPKAGFASRGGRYRPRWQTVFPGEDDICERAPSVYRSVTGEDQRIAFPRIGDMTLGRKYLTVFHLARHKSAQSSREEARSSCF
jgi:hypothetical protein